MVVGGHRQVSFRQLRPSRSSSVVGVVGAFAAGLVDLQPLGAGLLPGIEERLHRLPAGFDAVGALKQDVVADHAVVDQRLIAGATARP